jgi:hypothetical protein
MNQLSTGGGEHAGPDVHPLDWHDDFGPLEYTQFNEFVMHTRAIEQTGGDAAMGHALYVQLGYQDAAHFQRVWATFLKYWGKSTGGDTLRSFVWDDAALAAAMSALELREGVSRAKAAIEANPALVAPEAGVPIEACGWVRGWATGGRSFEEALAHTGLDAATWERAHQGWEQRVRADATGTLKALFSGAYHAGYGGSPPPNPLG